MNTASPTTTRSQRHDERRLTGRVFVAWASSKATEQGSAGLRRSGQ